MKDYYSDKIGQKEEAYLYLDKYSIINQRYVFIYCVESSILPIWVVQYEDRNTRELISAVYTNEDAAYKAYSDRIISMAKEM